MKPSADLRLVPLVLCCWCVGTADYICTPNPVGGLELTSDRVLHWDASTNCPNAIYRVQIAWSGQTMYEEVVPALVFDVDFLVYCRTYTFTVFAVANHSLGQTNSVTAFIPIPVGSDVNVTRLTSALINDSVLIEWQVGMKYPLCVEYYHLVIHDDDETQHLQVTERGYLLKHVAKCTNYRFEITSSYNGMNGTTIELNYTVPAATNTPSLVEVRKSSVSINTTWSLEKYQQNRCEVTALYVNGTRFSVIYPIDDVPGRPDIQVTLVGLRADSMYYFNVSVENNAGISPAFQIAVQTLPVYWN
ncbi:hypothetical protein NQ315_001389 [Exocentrus adspersus]|uniref:Fibronectin type-III domain-containing protein n=1 Tax=Exocentrus adspersus TaxID=1586481 RepID=A0AAV8WFR0_9CUCU|nr:hypothetical protein NQ315_001389 [Exocentrus adspersus]